MARRFGGDSALFSRGEGNSGNETWRNGDPVNDQELSDVQILSDLLSLELLTQLNTQDPTLYRKLYLACTVSGEDGKPYHKGSKMYIEDVLTRQLLTQEDVDKLRVHRLLFSERIEDSVPRLMICATIEAGFSESGYAISNEVRIACGSLPPEALAPKQTLIEHMQKLVEAAKAAESSIRLGHG